MDFKALKTALFVFLFYIVLTILLWWIFDFFYLTFNSTIKVRVQIKSKEIIFYVISMLTLVIFLNIIYKSGSKKEYLFGIALLISWVIYQTMIWNT